MCAGVKAPIISVTPTSKSVSISLTLPEFSLQMDQYYNISLQQTTGNSQTRCPPLEDSRPTVATTGNSMSFTDLEEFSSYRVTVTAVYDAFGVTRMASSNEGFTTLSAGRST